jgi:hypothetical protein
MRNVVTRKQVRKQRILASLSEDPVGKSNMDFCLLFSLKYPAVRAATAELAAEGRITGQVFGNERFGHIVWRIADATSSV